MTSHTAPPFEERLRAFLEQRGTDPDAMSAMFLLFRANTETVAAMESASNAPEDSTDRIARAAVRMSPTGKTSPVSPFRITPSSLRPA